LVLHMVLHFDPSTSVGVRVALAVRAFTAPCVWSTWSVFSPSSIVSRHGDGLYMADAPR
jgi:hypothetical protein